MNYNFTIKSNSAEKMKLLGTGQEQGSSTDGWSWASLKKGDHITGVVKAATDKITLDFYGQEVTVSKSVLSNAKPGDVESFEVVKADENEIELKLLGSQEESSHKTFTAVRVKDEGWDAIQAKQEQSSKKAGQETEYNEIKQKLKQIGISLSDDDCRRLDEEGFKVENFTAGGLYEALNRIKYGKEQGMDKKDSKEGEAVEGTEETKEKQSSLDKDALTKKLQEANLPATADNLNNLIAALNLSSLIAGIDDKTIQYLIASNATPSVENIYKAYYSGNSSNTEKLSDSAWSQLKEQVEDVIQAAGYEVNDQNRSDARWLIENQLPLTVDTFTYRKQLEDIRSEGDNEAIPDRMLKGMKNGIAPGQVSLLPEKNTDYGKLVEDINSISDEAVGLAVKDNSELTLRKLITIQERLTSGSRARADSSADTDTKLDKAEAFPVTDNAEEPEQSYRFSKGSGDGAENELTDARDEQFEALKARRQLEEIRLKMTVEAAGKLEKKGFSIDTEGLSRVVEELRKQENEYYQSLLKEADAETSELSVQTLRDTTQSVELLKRMPCSVLGSTLALRDTQTVTGLVTEGSRLAADHTKAGTAYETLATVPNSEYGDSLKKAFENSQSLLTQMGLDNTEENRRALRILGYNQMEITDTSINQVKAYDKQVTSLIQNLHPAVTVRMIKEGMNPLNMTINELNDTIDSIREEQGITSEDKYSTYLWKLEKQEGLTGEERKAYIGIYRLLYNVDQSDGAVLGAVIKADQEVTLGNLLTAVQTSKKGSIDSLVNDEFGSLDRVSYQGESIAEQLSVLNAKEGKQNSSQSEKDSKEQTQYLNRIIKQIKDEVTPQKLMAAGESLEPAEQSRSQTVAETASQEKGIWGKINQVPVEKLLEQLRNTEDTTQDYAYADKAQEIRELCQTSEQSIRFLNDYHMPDTAANIIMASRILSNGESPIKRLLKQSGENKAQNPEKQLKEINDLSDTLNDKSSMQDAYEELNTDAKEAIVRACSEEVIDSKKLAELKSISSQLTFLKSLSEKEFYQIPIETSKGITNMNLTIVRGGDTSGKVSVNVWSQSLGNIKAEFSLRDQVLKGFISGDNRSGLLQLKENTGELENAAQASNITIKQLDFCMQSKESSIYSYQNPAQETKEDPLTYNTERILYRIAKAVVQSVRTAENNSSEAEQAV